MGNISNAASMRLLMVIAWFIFWAADSAAQVSFQKSFGAEGYEKGSALKQLHDGGFIIAGESDKSFGSQESDMLLIRTDAGGNVMWGATYGGPEREVINDVVQTLDRGFLFVAEKYQPNKTEGEFLTLGKTDESGNLLWKKIFDEGGNETEGFAMAATPDGAYIITGIVKNMNVVSSAFFTMTGEDQSVYLLKADGNGNKLWSRKLNASSSHNISTTGASVTVASDGSYIIAGNVTKKGRTDKKIEKPVENVNADDARNLLLVKVKPDGSLAWAKEYRAGRITAGFSVIEKREGGFAVAGIATQAGDKGENVDIFLISMAADGSILWAKTFGGEKFESVAEVKQAADGGFVISGTTTSISDGINDALLFKTDNNGNLLWSKAYGGSGFEYATQIVLTPDGIVMTGESSSLPSESFDALLLKTDLNGNSRCKGADIPLSSANFQLSASDMEKAETSGVEQGITPPNFKKA
ncbi:MAG TPA: hypothetical protein VNJ07_10945, partial [Chitinophagales bacterium]|nr:hypothetical protein [Chitinophagales bacterium]